MKQFEYLTHSSDFIREVRKDSRGKLVEYDELQALGKQGWELITAQPGGKWVFKRETESTRKIEQERPIKPASADFDRGR
jgi:hypothetical protein